MCPSSVRPDRGDSAFSGEATPVLRTYPEFEDIPEDCPISVYSLSEIATEKVVAIRDRARNEPRYLYDLWFLASHAGVEIGHLIGAITGKSAFGKEILRASKPASSQMKLA